MRVVELLVSPQWIADRERSDPALAATRRVIESPVSTAARSSTAPCAPGAGRFCALAAQGLGAETRLRTDALRLLQVLIGCFEPVQGGPRQMERMVEIRRQVDLSPGKVAAAALARGHGISESALGRDFRAAFGQTLREYALGRRMSAGRDAILRDGMSVAQAAWLAGYDHAPNFTAAFRRHFGYAPGRLKPGGPDPGCSDSGDPDSGDPDCDRQGPDEDHK
ncbi:helix-turn-helix transcriptional regulator [Pseudogemmobacter sonorensis]|uniref:helix-turn-helix transcriptional regulator n=1 Tax=Pseudogemmobacter sonorensis TaxID=2989681 RepID=UPI003688EE60